MSSSRGETVSTYEGILLGVKSGLSPDSCIFLLSLPIDKCLPGERRGISNVSSSQCTVELLVDDLRCLCRTPRVLEEPV